MSSNAVDVGQPPIQMVAVAVTAAILRYFDCITSSFCFCISTDALPLRRPPLLQS